MKRRNILMSGAAAIAAPLAGKLNIARADSAPDPNRLKQDLTPLGAEKAASQSGLVPAWTGGVTTPPAGWEPGMPPPDLFGDEQPLFTVTLANMAQYADMLPDGQIQMLKRYGNQGYKIVVYPSHRTAAAAQYVYDNTFQNVTRAQPVPEGITKGFTGAVNGPPFPILSEDPSIAGVQAMWNHLTRWSGEYTTEVNSLFVVGNGKRVLTNVAIQMVWYPYYDPNMTPDTYSGFYLKSYIQYIAPPNQQGGKFQVSYSSQPYRISDTSYQYLVGEGRVRQAPKAEYDTPNPHRDDLINYDETYNYLGAPDRYTWKLLGKKEMIVPYNQYKVVMAQPEEIHGDNFINPDLIRHEVHRCWVVEGRLAPGARMTDPFRRFYIDEDTWCAVMSDLYDDQGNYWRWAYNILQVHPDLPGTTASGEVHIDLQQQQYTTGFTLFNGVGPMKSGYSFAPTSHTLYDHQSMVNSGGL